MYPLTLAVSKRCLDGPVQCCTPTAIANTPIPQPSAATASAPSCKAREQDCDQQQGTVFHIAALGALPAAAAAAASTAMSSDDIAGAAEIGVWECVTTTNRAKKHPHKQTTATVKSDCICCALSDSGAAPQERTRLMNNAPMVGVREATVNTRPWELLTQQATTHVASANGRVMTTVANTTPVLEQDLIKSVDSLDESGEPQFDVACDGDVCYRVPKTPLKAAHGVATDTAQTGQVVGVNTSHPDAVSVGALIAAVIATDNGSSACVFYSELVYSCDVNMNSSNANVVLAESNSNASSTALTATADTASPVWRVAASDSSFVAQTPSISQGRVITAAAHPFGFAFMDSVTTQNNTSSAVAQQSLATFIMTPMLRPVAHLPLPSPALSATPASLLWAGDAALVTAVGTAASVFVTVSPATVAPCCAHCNSPLTSYPTGNSLSTSAANAAVDRLSSEAVAVVAHPRTVTALATLSAAADDPCHSPCSGGGSAETDVVTVSSDGLLRVLTRVPQRGLSAKGAAAVAKYGEMRARAVQRSVAQNDA